MDGRVLEPCIFMPQTHRIKIRLIIKGTDEWEGVLTAVKAFCIKLFLHVVIMQDKLSVVKERQFQETACLVFDADGGIGQADLQMVPLFLPWESLNELDRLVKGSFFFVAKFAGFVVFVLDFGLKGQSGGIFDV